MLSDMDIVTMTLQYLFGSSSESIFGRVVLLPVDKTVIFSCISVFPSILQPSDSLHLHNNFLFNLEVVLV